MKYQAFISYKHSELSRKKAIAVEDAVKKYAKPWWKTHTKIFRDEKEMAPGVDLGASINNALENSDYLIYFASREAAESEWVQKELLKWCGDLKRTDKLIIIQIADNIATNPKENKIVWEQTDAIPSVLKEYIPYIPYYENLKWSKKDELLTLQNSEFKEIINRITATFRGMTPAELNDENVLIERRNKRMIKLATGVLSIFFIISIITTVIALVQKNIADEQYREAVKQKDIARKNEQHAKEEKKRGDEQTAIAKKNEQKALEEKRRADERTFEAICGKLASESGRLVHTDTVKAIRIAEQAYKIGLPKPSPETVRALISATYPDEFRSFYKFSLPQQRGRNHIALFSPDLKKILTASSYYIPKLWDIKGDFICQFGNEQEFNTNENAVFSPDSTKVIVTARYITIWDTKNKLLQKKNNIPIGAIHPSFSPDGTRFVTASVSSNSIVWDMKLNIKVELKSDPDPKAEKGHLEGYGTNTAVFSPDGQTILTASDDSTARLWDLNGRHIKRLNRHQRHRVNCATFSPDGTRILTASDDLTAKLWDNKGEYFHTLIGHTGNVVSAVFSPDGKKILTASSDNTAKLWDQEGNLLASCNGHTGSVFSAVFSSDGMLILTASRDNSAKIFDLEGNLLHDLRGHSNSVESAVFSPDGRYVLTAANDSTVKLWDLLIKPLKKFKMAIDGFGRSVAISPKWNYIITLDNGHDKHPIIDLRSINGKSISFLVEHTDWVESISFSPDGSKILTASRDNTAKIWDITGKPLANLQHNSWIEYAGFSHNGSRILTISRNGIATFWDINGNLVNTINVGTYDNSFFSNGFLILSTFQDGSAKLWDINRNERVKFKGHISPIRYAIFSPDGAMILTASTDKTTKLWDIKGNLKADITVHFGYVQNAVFSPDGSRILISYNDNTTKLWTIEGQYLQTMNHNNPVYSAVFSPDGSMILTAPSDDNAKLWDLNGNLLGEYKQTIGISNAFFSPDGQQILTVAFGGTIMIMYTPAGIMNWLKTAPIPKLTQQEKKELGINGFKID